jgi:hypothetical protein
MHNSRLYRCIPQARDMRRVQSTRQESMPWDQKHCACACAAKPSPLAAAPAIRACLSDPALLLLRPQQQ